MYYFFIIFAILVLFFPSSTYTIPPPEILIQITSQIVPIFGWIFAMLLAAGGTVWRFVRQLFKNQYILPVVGFFILVIVALFSAIIIDFQQQERQLARYEEQLQEQFSEQISEQVNQLSTSTSTDDIRANYIRMYYGNIAEGNLEAAYAMTEQQVSYDVFYSWYSNTTNVQVEKVEAIDDDTYSVRVALFEGNMVTRFGLLATVPLDQQGEPIRFVSENVVMLGDGPQEISTTDDELAVSNEEFQLLMNSGESPFVLDAREHIEYEYGRFPGSTHIKFADLEYNNGWTALPIDEPVYVFCWSGIRGSMVANFLREQGIDAYYLEEGANSWVNNGGTWEGEIAFSAVYEQVQYQKVYSKKEYEQLRQNGAIIIDSRNGIPAGKEIQGSIPIRLLYTPSVFIEQRLAEIPPNSNIISVCDDYVDCFDARLIGVEAEHKGHTFLGRYVYLD